MAETNDLWPEDPRGGSIIPLTRDAQGRLQWSWPNAMRGAVNDVHDLVTAPLNAMRGAYTPSELDAHGTRAALTLAGLGLGTPLPEGNTLHMFGGIKARTANMPALAKALTLEGRGQAPADIHAATGWFRGPDNKWRFEIPDSEAEVYKGYQGIDGKVDLGKLDPYSKSFKSDDFLYHPDLYSAYPQLRDTIIGHQPGPAGSGAFYSNKNKITLAPDTLKDILSTTLHEHQHGVQDIEGFAEGGNPDQFLSPDFYNKKFMAEQQHRDMASQIRTMGADPGLVQGVVIANKLGRPTQDLDALEHTARVINADPEFLPKFASTVSDLMDMSQQHRLAQSKYRNLAGEAESFLVQDRHATGDHTSFPPSTPGYPPYDKQTVVLGGETQGPMALTPIEHDPWAVTSTPVDHDPFAVETVNTTPGAAK